MDLLYVILLLTSFCDILTSQSSVTTTQSVSTTGFDSEIIPGGNNENLLSQVVGESMTSSNEAVDGLLLSGVSGCLLCSDSDTNAVALGSSQLLSFPLQSQTCGLEYGSLDTGNQLSTTANSQASFQNDEDNDDTEVNTKGNTLTARKHLLEVITTDYDSNIRPVCDQSRSILVATRFNLLGILSFDTQRQLIDIYGFIQIQWRDEIIWNNIVSTQNSTSKFDAITIPAANLWKPAIKVSKVLGTSSRIGSTDTDIALIKDQGIIEWVPEGIFRVPCEMNIQFYPFDVQTCTLSYLSSDETDTTMDLRHVGDVNTSHYIENSEWSIVKSSHGSRIVDRIIYVNIEITLKRRPGFGLLTMIMPAILISFLSSCTFLIPTKSGEKLCTTISIVLAYGIFLSVVTNNLPQNSLRLPYYVMYIDCELFLALVLALYSIIQSKVHHDIGHVKCSFRRYFNPYYKRFCVTFGNCEHTTWGEFLDKMDTIMFYVLSALHFAVFVTFLLLLITNI